MLHSSKIVNETNPLFGAKTKAPSYFPLISLASSNTSFSGRKAGILRRFLLEFLTWQNKRFQSNYASSLPLFVGSVPVPDFWKRAFRFHRLNSEVKKAKGSFFLDPQTRKKRQQEDQGLWQHELRGGNKRLFTLKPGPGQQQQAIKNVIRTPRRWWKIWG